MRNLHHFPRGYEVSDHHQKYGYWTFQLWGKILLSHNSDRTTLGEGGLFFFFLAGGIAAHQPFLLFKKGTSNFNLHLNEPLNISLCCSVNSLPLVKKGGIKGHISATHGKKFFFFVAQRVGTLITLYINFDHTDSVGATLILI